MTVAQLFYMVLGVSGLAIVRFGVPIVGIWLINQGCCLLRSIKI
jgi:hypothetical protein